MLRTITVRNQVLTVSLKKAIKSNISRCISTEILKRKHSNKLSTTKCQILSVPQWSNQMRYYSSYPSHVKVALPALSPTMETGSIVSWSKKEGDKLSEGDLLCEIETDKATMGFETPEEGYLAKIIIPEDTKGVPVGKLLCIIVESQADVAAFKDFKDDGVPLPSKQAAKASDPASAPVAAASPPPVPSAPIAAPAINAVSHAPESGRVYASPMARKLAEIKKIRLGGYSN